LFFFSIFKIIEYVTQNVVLSKYHYCVIIEKVAVLHIPRKGVRCVI